MPTSVPNFNFLAQLVSEICGGPNIKSGSSWFPQTPPSGHIFIQGASTRKCLQVCQISTSYSSISFRDKDNVPKFNVGATSPLPYPVRWNFYVFWKYLARSNSTPNFSIVSWCIVQLSEYVFPIGFPLCAQKWSFWRFWGWRCENIVF